MQERVDAILAALIRARKRAREIARRTGTPLVYRKDGQLINEYITDDNGDTTTSNQP